MIERIRRNLRTSYKKAFEYKGGFLNPVEWRGREFNEAADLVADHVIASKSDVSTFNKEDLRGCWASGCGIQIYTDGGFCDGIGSIAVVVIQVRWDAEQVHRKILGVRGKYVATATSSFQMELAALEMATEAIEEVARGVCS